MNQALIHPMDKIELNLWSRASNIGIGIFVPNDSHGMRSNTAIWARAKPTTLASAPRETHA
jgi:hypothetical protein